MDRRNAAGSVDAMHLVVLDPYPPKSISVTNFSMGLALCQRRKWVLSASREENNAGKCILEGLGDEGSNDILAQIASGPIDGHSSHYRVLRISSERRPENNQVPRSKGTPI